MVETERTTIAKDRLTELERTVTSLDNQLRTIRWGLQRSHAGSLSMRFWSFMRPKPRAEFMSAVCNQRVRSNNKLATHDHV